MKKNNRIIVGILIGFLILCMFVAADVVRSGEHIGVYRKTTHMFYLDYNGSGTWEGAVIDRQFNFGSAGDIPVVGKWDGPGRTQIGVWRGPTHTFYLDYNGNGAWDGAVIDRAYNFGLSSDKPISGDWDNNGFTDIGVYRPSTHMFYLDWNGNGTWDGAVIDRAYNFGLVNDDPVSGKWVPGVGTRIGVFRQSTHTFYLDYNGNGVWDGALADRQYNFGSTNDAPIPGDITGDLASEVGVYRQTTHMFYRDLNNNGAWDGALVDLQHNFGLAGDVPTVGEW